MDYDIGSIVMLENVVFKTAYLNNKLTRKVTFDHAKKRPAIIIAEDKENTYFLTITSGKSGVKKHKDRYYIGEKSKTEIGGYVVLTNIYKRNICFRNELCYLEPNDLLSLLIKFKKFQENIKMDEEYINISKIIDGKINELTYKKNKQKTLIKKVQFFY